jgi:hypothetical protein
VVVVTDEPTAPIRARVQHGAGLPTVLSVEDNRANVELVEQLIARRPDLRLLSVDAALEIAEHPRDKRE